MIVLDASALLASVQMEPGWEAVESVLDEAAISAVNYSEALSKLIEAGMDAPDAAALLSTLDLRIEPFDTRQAETTAALRVATRKAGLSLGDRACLALAQSHGAPVLTTDRAWSRIDVGVEIRQIR